MLVVFVAVVSGCGRAKSASPDSGMEPDGFFDHMSGREDGPDLLADSGAPDVTPPDLGLDAWDEPGCSADAEIFCASGAVHGDVGICSDQAQTGICDRGTWRCPDGMIETSLCTCDGAPQPGCTTCTAHGWVCNDAGFDGSDAGDAQNGDAHAEAGGDSPSPDGSCSAGCVTSTTVTFCNASEVQWTCQGGNYNPTSFNAYCRDPATNVQRYCCPPTFHPLCD